MAVAEKAINNQLANLEPPLPSIKLTYVRPNWNRLRGKRPKLKKQFVHLMKVVGQELNYDVYQREDGVRTPYASVSINDVVARYKDEAKPSKGETEVTVIFGCISTFSTPLTHGHLMLREISRGLKEATEDSNHKKRLVLVLGSPHDLDGRINQNWLKDIFKRNFHPHAEMDEQIIRKFLIDNQLTEDQLKFNFVTSSMGSSRADIVRNKFPSSEVEYNNNASDHPKTKAWHRFPEIGAGFLAEMAGSALDPDQWSYPKEFARSRKSLEHHLYAKYPDIERSNQFWLRLLGFFINYKNIAMGHELDKEKESVFKQAAFDLLKLRWDIVWNFAREKERE